MTEPVLSDLSVEQHFPMIFRTCRQNTPCEDSAWEAFQETFLVFARRRDDLDLESDYGPWLRETARRCSLAIIRKNRRCAITQTTKFESVIPTVSDAQVDAASNSEATAVLREEIAKLSVEDQELLTCLYAEGMSHRELAGRLKCPTGSVHAKAAEARRRLRKRMERRGIVVSILLLLLLQAKADGRWAPSIFIPRQSVWARRIEWSHLVAASLILFTIFIPPFLYLNVSLPQASRMADTAAEPRIATGYGCDVVLEKIKE